MTTATHRLSAVAAVAVLAVGVGAMDAAATPPSTEPPAPPIAVEELTRVDADTLARGNFTDPTGMSLRFTPAGLDEVVIDVADLSHAAVARITVQPGAHFPWHIHPGPVIVNITQGELVYVLADDCVERPYPTGTAFVDPGNNVHTAFNPTDGETVLVATFFGVTADGPLTITDGVSAPADNCGLEGAAA